MKDKLASEIIDASNGKGGAVKKKKTRTRWPRPIRRSLTTAGKEAGHKRRGKA